MRYLINTRIEAPKLAQAELSLISEIDQCKMRSATLVIDSSPGRRVRVEGLIRDGAGKEHYVAATVDRFELEAARMIVLEKMLEKARALPAWTL